MRLWKKALSVLLVSATAISMCACGGAKKGSGSSDTFKIGGCLLYTSPSPRD